MKSLPTMPVLINFNTDKGIMSMIRAYFFNSYDLPVF